MQLVLEQRAERSDTIALISPLIAIGADARDHERSCSRSSARTRSPRSGVYFIEPLTDSYSLQEIAVKATPLVMIAVGLSLCYLANIWNIGAEGQFLIGAVAGSWLAVKTQRHRRRPLGAAGDAAAGRARRRALRADPGDLQGAGSAPAKS